MADVPTLDELVSRQPCPACLRKGNKRKLKIGLVADVAECGLFHEFKIERTSRTGVSLTLQKSDDPSERLGERYPTLKDDR